MKRLPGILKSVYIMAILGLLAQGVSAQSKDDTYTINGTIKNITPMPSMVYLTISNYGNGQNVKDSALVKNGKYQFKGHIDEVKAASITSINIKSSGVYDTRTLYLEEGNIDLLSDGDFHNSVSSGPGSQADHDFLEATKAAKKTADSLIKISQSPEFKTDGNLRAHTQMAATNLLKPLLDGSLDFVKQHPQSPIAPELMLFLSGTGSKVSSATLDSLMATLPENSQSIAKRKIGAGLEAKRQAELTKKANDEKTGIGTVAADFTQKDFKGNLVSLSSFKGKYVLIDFWASWCGPCRAENPNVVKAYNTYKDKGFTILGVSLDGNNTKSAWLAAIKKDNLTWTEVSDLQGWKNNAATLYGVQSIPQNFLVDPNGVIIGRNLRGDDLQKKLASLFNK